MKKLFCTWTNQETLKNKKPGEEPDMCFEPAVDFWIHTKGLPDMVFCQCVEHHTFHKEDMNINPLWKRISKKKALLLLSKFSVSKWNNPNRMN